MRLARHWGAENWADSLPSLVGLTTPPVDLYAVARHRRIQHLAFRFMIPRGLLLPVAGGFDVFLRDQVHKDLDITKPEPENELSFRQRFSFAHELAHTRFYNLSDEVPSPQAAIANERQLEDLCDQMAGCILIPTHLLKGKIRKFEKEIDADFVRSIASDFRTSITVAIERLRIVEAGNSFERCILLAQRINGDAEIRSLYFGVGLLPIIPRPEKYTRITDWLPDFPRETLAHSDHNGSFVTRKGRTITFKTIELGDRILLELQAA